MPKYCLLLLPCLTALGATSCLAYPLSPDPYPGVPVTQTSINAMVTGNIIATFLGTSADATDLIRLNDETTGTYSAWSMNNKTSTPGQTFNFGFVNAGDKLAFEIESSSITDPNGYFATTSGILNPVESSDSAKATDGVSSFYASQQNGYLLLGAEDIPHEINPLYGVYYTTPNYDNVVFSVANVAGSSIVPTPEPGTFALLSTGVLGAAGAVRRRLTR